MFYQSLILLGLIWFQPSIQVSELLCYMVITIQIHLYIGVCVCVWVSCVCFALLMFQCNPSLLSTFLLHFNWRSYCFYFMYLRVTVTPVHRCVRVCEWMCWFCTRCFRDSPRHCSVLFFLHCGRFVDCIQKMCRIFCVFVDYPFISMVGHFWPEDKCDLFLRPLSLIESSPIFFFVCVHIPNAIKVTYHSDEAVICKN